MGIGDDILATAEAKFYHELYGQKVVFALGDQLFYNEEIYANNPRIMRNPKQGDKVVVIRNGPGCRPYIAGGDSKRWYWNTDFRAEPGEIYLTPQEIEQGARARGKILIEPHVKQTTWSQNKHWPHWKEFVELAKDLPLAQMSYDKREVLVERLPTQSFRDALKYIANAELVITPDGALHHACAALGVPCITLWGGLITPDILGYETQTNLWHGAEACGSKHDCRHCHEAMKSITPEEVLEVVNEKYQRHLAT